jgi:hypothetical protein
MEKLTLPKQHVVCPKCMEDYFDDDAYQQCPSCDHQFHVSELPARED